MERTIHEHDLTDLTEPLAVVRAAEPVAEGPEKELELRIRLEHQPKDADEAQGLVDRLQARLAEALAREGFRLDAPVERTPGLDDPERAAETFPTALALTRLEAWKLADTVEYLETSVVFEPVVLRQAGRILRVRVTLRLEN